MEQETKISLEDLYKLYGNVSLVKREIDLEMESKTLAYNKYMKILNDNQANGVLSPSTQILMSEAMTPLIKAIQSFLDDASQGKTGRRNTAYKVCAPLSAPELALITIKTIFSSAIKQKYGIPLVALCKAVGDRIIEEIHCHHIIDAVEFDVKKNAKSRTSVTYKRAYYSAIERHAIANGLKEKEESNVTNYDRVRCGLKFIELFIESTGLGSLFKVPHKGGFSYTFKIDDYITAYLFNNDESLADLSYIKRPMLLKPLEWSNPYNGGYLLKLKGDETFIKCNKHTLKFYEDIDMPKVYKAINALQSTPWRINKRILGVLTEIRTWMNPPSGLDFPTVSPLGDKPECPKGATQEQLKEFKRKANLWYSADVQRQGRRILVEMLYSQAKDYKNEDAIYFPYSIDFRGRAYPMTLLNPQGSDLNKALLLFAEGVPLGEHGAKWLAFHGANLWGLDKKPFEERLEWVYSHSEFINSIANDPLNDLSWCDADSPWEFLAWCFEWSQYLSEGESFISHIPVAFDGSCSGLQHYSAMLRDSIGASAVNLIPDTKVHDIYGIVAEKVNQRLLEDYQNGTKDAIKLSPKTKQEYTLKGTSSMAREWLDYGQRKYGTRGISRKETKRSVMTLCYGSKKYGFGEQVYEDTVAPSLYDNPLGFSKPKQSATYLGGLIWDSVQSVVVKAVEGMEWLQKASSLLANQRDNLGNPLPTYWVTPAGFPVKQEYHKTLMKQVELCLGEKVLYKVVDTTGLGDKVNGRYVPLVAQDIPETIDSRKQRQGIAPNFVHSMDASHMMLTVDSCVDAGITSFAMIHDSYGTHAGNAETLFRIVREVFVDTYSKHNVLADIRAHVANMLPDDALEDLPEIPTMGDLDLEQVKQSLYAFA